MEFIFVSYSRESEMVASAIGAALEGLGATCAIYQLPGPDTAVDCDTIAKLKSQAESAGFFIQLVGRTPGRPVSSCDDKPFLQLEMEWYLEARNRGGDRRPLPLVLELKGGESGPDQPAVSRHLAWTHDQGVGSEMCPDANAAIRVAVGWFVRYRHLSSEIATIDGSLDILVGQPPVSEALDAALLQGVPLPQKYLYTSQVASILWNKLLSSNKSKTKLMFETIDYRSANLSGTRAILRHVAQWPMTCPISIIALGCGDGQRECTLVRTISSALPHRRVSVLLVDVSKTLITQATKWFSAKTFGNDDAAPTINFALADFEHPRSMASLMRRWSSDLPCISILLGNTLGNIDSRYFLQAIASAMKPGDLLAVEIAIAHEAEHKAALEAAHSGWKHASPQQRDENFEFVCGPIRALGINPKIERFRSKMTAGDWAVHRFYGYQLTAQDMSDIQAVIGKSDIDEHILQLIRFDSFHEERLEAMFPRTLRIIAKDICSCNRVMKEGRPAKMGFVIAEKVAVADELPRSW